MPTRADQRIFIIAEAGVNHNGSVELGERLIEAAASSGADAVKFQSFRTESLVSRTARRADYQIRNQPGEHSQLDMLKKLELGEPAQRHLSEYAAKHRIEFMSTPFDLESLRFLVHELKVKRLKIASGDITNAPLLLAAARSGLPLIVSTGMSTLEDVESALGVISFGSASAAEPRGAGDFTRTGAGASGRVALLHCTSDYPAPMAALNLRAMETMRKKFDLPVGLSDHSLGIAAPIAAAAMGAAIIEKHFTLDRNLPGPDHRASLEPAELTGMISAVRDVCSALGSGAKEPTEAELHTRSVARRSLVAARAIRRGEKLGPQDIVAKRPGTGVSPLLYWDWVGKLAERDYEEDDLL